MSNPLASFELPSDIHEMLDNSLIEATELNAKHANTAKYFLEGRPDLFVRCLPGQRTSGALQLGQSLGAHGVNMLPYHVVEHNGEEWVITTKVTGDNLEGALTASAANRNDALIEAIDSTWTGLAENLIDARDARSSVVYDIDGICQYMWGTIAPTASDDPKVLLVDLPQFTWPTDIEYMYGELVLSLANGIVEAENVGSVTLSMARSAIEHAVERVDVSTDWLIRLSRASQYVLKHSVGLDPYDDEDAIWEISDSIARI